jgi:hypothetical protein
MNFDEKKEETTTRPPPNNMADPDTYPTPFSSSRGLIFRFS